MFTSLDDDDDARQQHGNTARTVAHAMNQNAARVVQATKGALKKHPLLGPVLEQVKEQGSKVKQKLWQTAGGSNSGGLWESKGNLVFGPQATTTTTAANLYSTAANTSTNTTTATNNNNNNNTAAGSTTPPLSPKLSSSKKKVSSGSKSVGGNNNNNHNNNNNNNNNNSTPPMSPKGSKLSSTLGGNNNNKKKRIALGGSKSVGGGNQTPPLSPKSTKLSSTLGGNNNTNTTKKKMASGSKSVGGGNQTPPMSPKGTKLSSTVGGNSSSNNNNNNTTKKKMASGSKSVGGGGGSAGSDLSGLMKSKKKSSKTGCQSVRSYHSSKSSSSSSFQQHQPPKSFQGDDMYYASPRRTTSPVVSSSSSNVLLKASSPSSPSRASLTRVSPNAAMMTDAMMTDATKTRRVIIRKADGTTVTRVLKPGEVLSEKYRRTPNSGAKVVVRRKSLGGNSSSGMMAPNLLDPPGSEPVRRNSFGDNCAAPRRWHSKQQPPDPDDANANFDTAPVPDMTPRQRYRRATMSHVTTSSGTPVTPGLLLKKAVRPAPEPQTNAYDVFDTRLWPETPALHTNPTATHHRKKAALQSVPLLDHDDDDDTVKPPPSYPHENTRLYDYARQCQWKAVAEECRLFPRDAKCVEASDGTTALHLAVMSRVNPVLRDGTLSHTNMEPAPLELIEQLVSACPEAAIIRDSVKKYTPLTYACLVLDKQHYSLADGQYMVQVILQHAPQSAYVFTDDGFSALDVHILSYSRFHRRPDEGDADSNDTAGHATSTLVLGTLLEARPDLAEARSYKNRVRGPLELLYRSNLELFKNIGNNRAAAPSPDVVSERWWAWKWVDRLLQQQAAKINGQGAGQTSDFHALHAACSLVGCPMPILMIAAQNNPDQLKTVVNATGNLPLHEVCQWICDKEMIAGDPFVQRRKTAALESLLQLYPQAAMVRNNMGETALQLAIESKTPFHGGLSALVAVNPDALSIPRKLRAVDDDNELLLSIDVYDDHESVDSDWVDPVLAVEGMYPFMVAAVVSFIPDSRRKPSFFSDQTPAQHEADLKTRELEHLRTIYGLLRARPSVFGLYQPVFRSIKSEHGDDSSSEYTEIVDYDDDSDYTEVTFDE